MASYPSLSLMLFPTVEHCSTFLELNSSQVQIMCICAPKNYNHIKKHWFNDVALQIRFKPELGTISSASLLEIGSSKSKEYFFHLFMATIHADSLRFLLLSPPCSGIYFMVLLELKMYISCIHYMEL